MAVPAEVVLTPVRVAFVVAPVTYRTSFALTLLWPIATLPAERIALPLLAVHGEEVPSAPAGPCGPVAPVAPVAPVRP